MLSNRVKLLSIFLSVFILFCVFTPQLSKSSDGYPYRIYLSSDSHDSIIYFFYVINGADSTLVDINEDDTVTAGAFPYDSTLILNSDSAYQILFLWFANGNSTPDAVWEAIPRRIDTLITALEFATDTSAGGPWASAQDVIDSLFRATIADTTSAGTYMSTLIRFVSLMNANIDTLQISIGYKANAFTYQYRSTDIDTLVIGIGTDTLWDVIYYHTGQGAGAAPDSTRVQAHP